MTFYAALAFALFTFSITFVIITKSLVNYENKFREKRERKNLPSKGDRIPFYDEGKFGEDKRYIAIVKSVTSFKRMKLFKKSIYNIWLKRKNMIINKIEVLPDSTDYFIKCVIPGYQNEPVYFVRSKSNDWVSFPINEMKSGVLDVSGKYSLRILRYDANFYHKNYFIDFNKFNIKLNYEKIEKGYHGKYLIKEDEARKIFFKYCNKALREE